MSFFIRSFFISPFFYNTIKIRKRKFFTDWVGNPVHLQPGGRDQAPAHQQCLRPGPHSQPGQEDHAQGQALQSPLPHSKDWWADPAGLLGDHGQVHGLWLVSVSCTYIIHLYHVPIIHVISLNTMREYIILLFYFFEHVAFFEHYYNENISFCFSIFLKLWRFLNIIKTRWYKKWHELKMTRIKNDTVLKVTRIKTDTY